MDARTYLETFKDAGAERLVAALKRAGRRTTVGYFKQIAYGHRRPSPELADLMVKHDPQKQLDFIALLTTPKSPNGGRRVRQ